MAIIVGWAAGATGRDVALIDADAPAASRPISDPGRGTAAESSAGESPQLPVRVQLVPLAELPRVVAERESAGPKPRWVWHDTAHWYPALLDAGVRVERCHDLRLCHAILHGSVLAAGRALHGDGAGGSAWDAPPVPELLTPPPPPHAASALFDIDDFGASRAAGGAHAPGAPADDALPASAAEALAEWQRQAAAVSDGTAPERLRLLLAAESAGALMASEMHAAGLPWRADVHDRILVASLGPKPAPGALPERMALLARAVRDALGEPELHLDSQPRLLRALHRAGIFVESTSRWELRRHSHPAIEPLLEYKKLARLLSANGWAWLEEWVLEGRFRPTFVPGGVVTGRWASSGGGALQLPKQLRADGRSSRPTSPSSSRACSPRWQATRRWPRRAAAPICTRASSRPAPSTPASTRSSRCWAPCTARRRARAAGSCRGCVARSRRRWASSITRLVPASGARR